MSEEQPQPAPEPVETCGHLSPQSQVACILPKGPHPLRRHRAPNPEAKKGTRSYLEWMQEETP